MNNMKQIALALLNYESVHGVLPPAYTVDDDGKPMHSWRVLILPYIEEQALFDAYDFDEPWDGPNNSTLADKMPEVFRCPSCAACARERNNPWKLPGKNCTNYFAVVDPETILRAEKGRSFLEIGDGTSNTILFLEAADRQVNWMAPEDLSLDEAVTLLSSRQSRRHLQSKWRPLHHSLSTRRWQRILCRRTSQLSLSADRRVRPGLVDCRGWRDDQRERNCIPNYSPPEELVIIRWDRVFSFSVFVALALLPVVRWKQRE